MRVELVVGAVLAGALGCAGAAKADTFVLDDTGGHGSSSAIAGGFRITGPDTSPLTPGPNTTSLVATAAAPETVTYYWQYVSFDSISSFYDPGGFVVNGVQTQLTTTLPSLDFVNGQFVRPTQSGAVTFNLNPGDTYGFYVASTDSQEGAGVLRFSTVASAVPEPAAWVSMIFGFGMVGAGLRCRRRLAAA